LTQNTTIPRWHSRGYLPHFEAGQRAQFLTLHLADSLPQEVLQNWRRMLEHRGAEGLARSLRIKIESYLDAGYGACYLRQAAVASTVENALLHFDGVRYRLRSWVVMPNHIHFLLTPIDNHPLSQIMHSLKSYTALKANRMLGRTGEFWMEDYFDRYIRDENQYEKTIAYIENNPVKARLCSRPEEWRFSSAWWRAKKNRQ